MHMHPGVETVSRHALLWGDICTFMGTVIVCAPGGSSTPPKAAKTHAWVNAWLQYTMDPKQSELSKDDRVQDMQRVHKYLCGEHLKRT
jgi:hypothetical protein